MRSSTALRICVVAEMFFWIGGLALTVIFEEALPDHLKKWLESVRPNALHSLSLLVIFIPSLLCSLVSWIGLLCLRPWAAWLTLVNTIVGFAILPFCGANIEFGLSQTFNHMSTCLSGAVLGIAFFGAPFSEDQDVSEGAAGPPFHN